MAGLLGVLLPLLRFISRRALDAQVGVADCDDRLAEFSSVTRTMWRSLRLASHAVFVPASEGQVILLMLFTFLFGRSLGSPLGPCCNSFLSMMLIWQL